ncbi:hypothetical protein F4813DRAFT_351005 [Daldinia decipiens]|uniref:uncharacterized protein n=1 Tax=Daldinia decipiens TaxID=326647 RepID=UPI0020C5610A|nr:uncharacterized protein F4813DRAFT_351005 [Daldinia decipiens]KAI1660116.1 hypothetical protein F4813DRAFT_351005 [Daldinia decipiens]
MATDSLKALITNIPDWLKRLEELNGQIDQRQQDLAMLPENQPKSSARSIRNKGSTESLRPRDEGAPGQILDTIRVSTPPPLTPIETRQPNDGAEVPSSPMSEPRSNASLQRQTNEVMATAQRRARAVVRKKPKTESMMSTENTVQNYRSRNMIIVYYDSYVQSFFEELVKFVSMQRNAMRKAKMAAKVARIRRLAEIEMPDDDEEDRPGSRNGELKPRDNLIAVAADATAAKEESAEDIKLRFKSTRQMGPRNVVAGRVSARVARSGLNGGLGAFQERGDIWEELDKGLEFVQGMCEQGAHQFLRDGDCAEEIEKIKARLALTKEAADKELARPDTENTLELASPWPIQSRSYRPTMMRKSMGTPALKTPPKQEVIKQNVIEVEDEGIQDMDDYQPISKPTGQIDGPTS